MARQLVHVRWRYVVYLAVVVFAAAVCYSLIAEVRRTPGGEIWHVATFLGSVMITVGWVVTSETAIRNSKRQHTIALITSHLLDKHRIESRAKIKALLKGSNKLTRDIVDFDDDSNAALSAIDMELNFYEFVFAAVRRDDIDEHLLKDCLRGMFLQFYAQSEDYINHWRSKRARTWSFIAENYVRWRE